MISVIDYGVANLGSMLNMLRRIGAEASVARDPEDVNAATKIILPGVGSFDQGVLALRERNLFEVLRHKVRGQNTPILGVCLGMQLLGASSEEGQEEGLGLVDARAERFSGERGCAEKVPHIGWATLDRVRADPLLAGLAPEARFYFVHSYHVVCREPEDVVAFAHYGRPFCAILRSKNVFGAQFHPEKSHRYGMQMLRNFAEL